MKRSPDTQINAFFHWHLEISMASFFYCGCVSSAQLESLASSDTTSYYRPAPDRTDGTPDRDERPRDNGYKSVFTNSWLVCQRHRSWIKGLGKNQQKEWTRSLFAVPFVWGHWTVTPWTLRNDCVHTSQPQQWHATRGMLISLPATHTEIGIPIYDG